MRKFVYRAKKDGITISGIIEAKAEKDASKLLHEQNLFVVSIKPQNQQIGAQLFTRLANRITLGDIVNFTRQLSSMITAGLTLTEALAVLQNQVQKESLRAILEEVLTDIEGGASFSHALEKQSAVFKPVYVAMIRAAEEAGLLDKVLARLAENLEKEKEFRGKIISALIYPVIIIVGMIAVAFIMMFFVIPTIKNLYQEMSVTLPLPTQIVIALSNFVTRFWFLVAGLVVLAFFGLSSYRRTDIGQRQIDSLTLRLPILGHLRQLIILTEMSRTLGLLVGAGTPIVESINITAQTAGSIWYKDSLEGVARKVEKGISFGEALSSDPRFPSILTQMGKVGETTGKLDETLLKVSSYFETEAEQQIKTLTTTLEPLIMVILGVGVAFLIIAVIMPIYNLTTAF